MRLLAEWPREERRGIRGVLTDIDDTLTTGGRLIPEVLASLERLRAAGLHVVAVTGRPTYWAMPLLRLCGFDAVVAENGASAFWLDGKGRQQEWFYADGATRLAHRRSLEQFAEVLQARFPFLAVTEDAPQRIGDLAFDIGENIDPLSNEQVTEIAAFVNEHGLHVAASSIHLHVSLAPFSKQVTTAAILADVFGIDDAAARESFVFVGDSGNDASMFAHYPHSIGVSNVERHLHKLPKPPAYITRQEAGAGFVEVAQAILAT